MTDFEADRWRDLPGIAVAALGLRRGWHDVPGSVGLWLWTRPLQRRSGSVSVWLDAEALQGFVATARHRRIMQRFGGRGRMTSSAWPSDVVNARELWSRASVRLARDAT